MDPATIAMAGSSLASTLAGIFGQSSANKLAKKQMEQNFGLAQEQLALTKDDAKLARAGTTDELGNSVYYDPNTNSWKTVLSADGQQISDANRSEQLRQLQYDLPMARAEAIQNALQRTRERQTAGALGQQLNDQVSGRTGVTGSSIASALRMGRQQALSAGQRQATKAFNTNALRTGMGAGAAADALSSAGQDWADQAKQTLGNAALEGRQTADEMNQQSRGSLVDAYSAMASRASGSPGASYTPSNQNSALASTLANARNGAISGSNAATANAGTAGARLGAINGQLSGQINNDYSKYFNGATDIITAISNNRNRRNSNTVTYGSYDDAVHIPGYDK